jgi:glutaredoxin
MKLTIYSKSGCPYCEKIKTISKYLEEQRGFSVVVYNLDVDFNREQFYAEFGVGSTFPQVVLDELHLGGCTDSVKYLQENNLL